MLFLLIIVSDVGVQEVLKFEVCYKTCKRANFERMTFLDKMPYYKILGNLSTKNEVSLEVSLSL